MPFENPITDDYKNKNIFLILKNKKAISIIYKFNLYKGIKLKENLYYKEYLCSSINNVCF